MQIRFCDLCGEKLADAGMAELSLGYKEQNPEQRNTVDLRGHFTFRIVDPIEGEPGPADICRPCQRKLFLIWASFLKPGSPAQGLEKITGTAGTATASVG